MQSLVTETPTDVTMIGDTVDDGVTAKLVGVNCVLVSTGAQRPQELADVGWPVKASLTEAVATIVGN